MKQYNKLGLIAFVTITLGILLLMNVTDLARLIRYEPVPTDNPLLINIAVSNALTLIVLKCVLYSYIIYLGIIFFYRVYQRDIEKKQAYDRLKKVLDKEIKDFVTKVVEEPDPKPGDVDMQGNQIFEQPTKEKFNARVVDLEFEPKIPNDQRLECYNTFTAWEVTISNIKGLDINKALMLNKFIAKAKYLISDAMLTKQDFHNRPKYIVDNIDLSLSELDEVKGYLTNELEEYITSLIPVLKKE